MIQKVSLVATFYAQAQHNKKVFRKGCFPFLFFELTKVVRLRSIPK